MTRAEPAMGTLCIRLEARAPERRCFRSYEIAAGQDLFGLWMVEMSYGRIGVQGRTKTRSFCSRSNAIRQVQACLQRRATAPRRIGVPYRLRGVRHDDDWRRAALASSLRRFATEDVLACDDSAIFADT
jgi:predicted DNA-binding WGR domain protein